MHIKRDYKMSNRTRSKKKQTNTCTRKTEFVTDLTPIWHTVCSGWLQSRTAHRWRSEPRSSSSSEWGTRHGQTSPDLWWHYDLPSCNNQIYSVAKYEEARLSVEVTCSDVKLTQLKPAPTSCAAVCNALPPKPGAGTLPVNCHWPT